jgi:WD40 repeat protein
LREWLTEDRELIRRVWHIGLAAAAWDAAGRADSELYRGARLEAADEVMATMADQLTEPEHDFVVASRAAADAATARERRTRRRLRRGFVATSVALIVALVAGSAALQQREQAEREADEADVARLISLSGSLIDTKRDVAALLALEASHRSPGPATTRALGSLLFDDPALLGHLSTGTAAVGSIEWDPEGEGLYAVGLEAAEPVRIDPQTHEITPVPTESWQPGEYVRWFVPVGDGSALVADATGYPGARPSAIERVDLRDGHVIARTPIERDAEPLRPVVSPDGRRAAVLLWKDHGRVGEALVIDIASMHVLAAVPQPGPPSDEFWGGDAAWLDDERVLVGSPSGRLLVWDPGRDVVVGRWNDPPANDITDATALRLSPDRETLVVVGHLSGRMMAFDTTTGAPRWPEAVEVGAMVALDPRSNLVWAQEAGIGSSRMFAYDLLSGRQLPGERDVQNGTVCDARTSPDGTTLALASCHEGTITIWSLDGRASAGAAFAPPGWSTAPKLWSPDGRFVATFRADDPERIEVVDVSDGRRHTVGGATAAAASPPAFRQDGILQIVDARSNHIVEHDPSTGGTLDTGIELPGRVSSNVAVRGGRSAYGLDDGRIALVETGDRQLVRTISTDLSSILSLAWSADGARIFAAGQTEEAQVFDVASGARIETLPAPAGSLAVSPDHATLVTGAFDGSINLYDAETLQPMGDLLGGITTFPSQIQFTPDGRTIIVSGIDSTMRFFDVASRLELGGPLAITSPGAAVAPDSSELAVSTEHGVQRLALDVEALQIAACELAGRNLTIEEWEEYIGGAPRATCPSWPAPVAQLEPTAPDERRIRNQAGLSS